ncbi:hypothetical protein K2173_017747 [Erythroxylum novogranatense]|uniref:Uncharacterized protein n=1 Tax=Erythroxylum novogranatense TaxID=1862640 RepID=A0AAV8SLL2_9ROSI|nr:hypothetical protein K2173_017747 [Erythroxylum novogranatense]
MTELQRGWTEDIRVEIRAQQRNRPNQWRRDPSTQGNTGFSSVNQGFQTGDRVGGSKMKILNSYNYYPRQFSFPPTHGPHDVASSEIGPDLTTQPTNLVDPINVKEGSVMEVDDSKKRQRSSSTRLNHHDGDIDGGAPATSYSGTTTSSSQSAGLFHEARRSP